MKGNTAFATLALIVGLAAPSSAMDAQGRGNARGHSAQHQKAAKKQQKQFAKAERKQDRKHDRKNDGDRWVFDRDRHTRVIRDYRRYEALPPGLAKRESLPPGLRRQLRERGQLPPGLQKRLVGVPGGLDSRLPPIPPYYDRYFAGDDLIVVDRRSNTIAGILRDALR